MRHFSFLPILWLRFGQGQPGSPSFFHFFFSPSSLSIHLAESPFFCERSRRRPLLPKGTLRRHGGKGSEGRDHGVRSRLARAKIGGGMVVALIEKELDPHLQGNGKGRKGKHLLIRLERGEGISIFKSPKHFLLLVLEHRSWSASSSEKGLCNSSWSSVCKSQRKNISSPPTATLHS